MTTLSLVGNDISTVKYPPSGPLSAADIVDQNFTILYVGHHIPPSFSLPCHYVHVTLEYVDDRWRDLFSSKLYNKYMNMPLSHDIVTITVRSLILAVTKSISHSKVLGPFAGHI